MGPVPIRVHFPDGLILQVSVSKKPAQFCAASPCLTGFHSFPARIIAKLDQLRQRSAVLQLCPCCCANALVPRNLCPEVLLLLL